MNFFLTIKEVFPGNEQVVDPVHLGVRPGSQIDRNFLQKIQYKAAKAGVNTRMARIRGEYPSQIRLS